MMNKSGLILAVVLLSQLLSILLAEPCIVRGPRQSESAAEAYCDTLGCDKLTVKPPKRGNGNRFVAKCDCSRGPSTSSTGEAEAFCESVGCNTDGVQGNGGGCAVDPDTGIQECGDPYYWATCSAKPVCTAPGEGPSQVDMDTATAYCEDNGCFLISGHCNYGALSFDPETGEQIFNENPLPCTPTCGDTEPPGGAMWTAVAAHKPDSVAINDNGNHYEGDIMKQFYEMKNEMNMNNVMLIACFTTITFIISCSMLCIYHKMIKNNGRKVKYEFVDQEDEVQINS